ncbi:hypothetical protein D3Y59_09120 [Hymenobacter oligotrophus]|uniref:DegT/DnrJ/EryC1/StrS aminotransferase family protein n=1 Tax=Hymenobacter oligotrophus TaxID=2319843 RepID=A0A3B7RSV5_9BACT|nr:DegT/DnrJ/EryC1/StrS family aminotransferase [Hymenobacter oligotrophus]AYA37197.1 hypothetical protein D3Y59_09120 [Hymenobacter oligotrophus]
MKNNCNTVYPSVSNGFVFNSHDDLLPDYRINSFTAYDLAVHHSLKHATDIDDYFDQRFAGKTWQYTASGSHGISEVLKLLKLKPDDCITILTSTGNTYISGCVTREIEKVCQWSMKIEVNTKAIFVNHEFGIPFPNLARLKKYGVPIIEDCCYAFNSTNSFGEISQVGDFVIYSFAKFFSIQFGGIVVANNKYELNYNLITEDSKLYIQKVMSFYLKEINSISEKRLYNYKLLSDKLAPLALSPRFELKSGEVPGVYMFKVECEVDLQALKSYLWKKGIQCSVFYGEKAFFIPLHQKLNEVDFAYFYECIRQFIYCK